MRSEIEYLITANDIIVLDSYFNLTTNLISMTCFNTIFDHLVVALLAYFFGATLYTLLIVSGLHKK